MKRIRLTLAVAAVMAMTLVMAGPASAQGGGCKDFGQNVVGLATSLGGTFGQITAADAPANDTVEAEQAALCGPEY